MDTPTNSCWALDWEFVITATAYRQLDERDIWRALERIRRCGWAKGCRQDLAKNTRRQKTEQWPDTKYRDRRGQEFWIVTTEHHKLRWTYVQTAEEYLKTRDRPTGRTSTPSPQ